MYCNKTQWRSENPDDGKKKRGTSCNIFSTFYNHQYTKKKAYASSVANSQYQMNFCKDFFNYFGFYVFRNDYPSKAQSTYCKEFELFIILKLFWLLYKTIEKWHFKSKAQDKSRYLTHYKEFSFAWLPLCLNLQFKTVHMIKDIHICDILSWLHWVLTFTLRFYASTVGQKHEFTHGIHFFNHLNIAFSHQVYTIVYHQEEVPFGKSKQRG